MRRTGFRKPSYEEALSRRIALQQRERENAHGKPHRAKLARKNKQSMCRKGLKRSRPSPQEVEWRKTVLERDGYQCRWVDENGERCEIRGKENLDAHHVLERSQRPDLILELSNGAALCNGPGRHHDRLHHTVEGRKKGRELGLLGGETYEMAHKKSRSMNED